MMDRLVDLVRSLVGGTPAARSPRQATATPSRVGASVPLDHSVQDALRDALARGLMAMVRGAIRLPDAVIAELLRLSEQALEILDDEGAPLPLKDLTSIVATDPTAFAALRAMILESRDGQLLSTIKGVLAHHTGEPYPVPAPLELPERPSRPLELVLVGTGLDATLLAEAYGALPEGFVHVQRLEPSDKAGLEHVDADALEVADGAEVSAETLSTLLAQGTHVSIHHTALRWADELVGLAGAAHHGDAWLRVFHPVAYHPPFRQLVALVEGGTVGEVGTIRVRGTIGGHGGRLDPHPPEVIGYLDHPAFDLFGALTIIGGPVAAVGSYLNPMLPGEGGQGLVTVKHQAAGRYGLLECSWAPGLHARSHHYPYDMAVEVSGTDGIIWLRRGMAKPTQEPPIKVRVGRRAYTIGMERGLDERWEASHELAARAFVAHALVPRLRPDLVASLRPTVAALEARETALRAADEPGIHQLGPKGQPTL